MRARGSLTQCPSGSPRSPANHPCPPALRKALGNNSWDGPVSTRNQSSSCPSRTSGVEPGRGAHSLPLLGPQTFRSPCGPPVHTNRPAPNFLSLSWGPAREKKDWRAFMKNHLLDGPSPAPFSLPVPGCAAVPFLRRVVERVGIAQRGGGAPHAWRLRVVEVRLRVSVLVVRLVLRPAGVARGQKEWSVGSFPASASTQRPTGAHDVPSSKRHPSENCLF